MDTSGRTTPVPGPMATAGKPPTQADGKERISPLPSPTSTQQDVQDSGRGSSSNTLRSYCLRARRTPSYLQKDDDHDSDSDSTSVDVGDGGGGKGGGRGTHIKSRSDGGSVSSYSSTGVGTDDDRISPLPEGRGGIDGAAVGGGGSGGGGGGGGGGGENDSRKRKSPTSPPGGEGGVAGAECWVEGCTKKSRGSTGRCRRHGGGVTCIVPGCTGFSRLEGKCSVHGGAQMCLVHGCDRRARFYGRCTRHGGFVNCQVDRCTLRAVSKGRCAKHGGKDPCRHPGCTRPGLKSKGNWCVAHSRSLNTYLYQRQRERGQGLRPVPCTYFDPSGGCRCADTATASVGGPFLCPYHLVLSRCGGGVDCKASCPINGRCVRHAGEEAVEAECQQPGCCLKAAGDDPYGFCEEHKQWRYFCQNRSCVARALVSRGWCPLHHLAFAGEQEEEKLVQEATAAAVTKKKGRGGGGGSGEGRQPFPLSCSSSILSSVSSGPGARGGEGRKEGVETRVVDYWRRFDSSDPTGSRQDGMAYSGMGGGTGARQGMKGKVGRVLVSEGVNLNSSALYFGGAPIVLPPVVEPSPRSSPPSSPLTSPSSASPLVGWLDRASDSETLAFWHPVVREVVGWRRREGVGRVLAIEEKEKEEGGQGGRGEKKKGEGEKG